MERSGGRATGLAIPELEIKAELLLSKNIARSTDKVYTSAQRIFLDLCQRLSLTPMPVAESTLILFVTELAQTRAYSTIRTCLAGVRHLHIIHNYGNPLEKKLKLDLVLKGIHQVQPNRKAPRLPVTLVVLEKIQQGLSQAPGFESVMLWAACCLGFFGFLRCGEFLPQNVSQFDPERHLTAADVAVENHLNPTRLAVRIKLSKTDQFGHSTTIYIGISSRNYGVKVWGHSPSICGPNEVV